MRVALVSPYSWTYPGGVTSHIEALAGELIAAGHDVRVLAPFDEDGRRSALAHRGARPRARREARVADPARADDRLALQRRRLEPVAHALRGVGAAPGAAIRALRRRPRPRAGVPRGRLGRRDRRRRPRGGDVPLLLRARRATRDRQPDGRAAQARPPRRADRGERGRRVDRPALLRRRATASSPTGWRVGGAPPPRVRAPGEPLRIAFVGRAVERKGLPMLLRAFEALRREVPAELTVVGVEQAELAPLLLDDEGVRALGRVDDAEKRAVLEAADVLCAPSLGGESFGMVLTEAFAAGTPVIASDIAGLPRRRHRRRRRPARPARRRHPPRRGAARPGTRRAPRGWRRARPAAPSGTRGRGWRPRSPRSTSAAQGVPAARRAAGSSPAGRRPRRPPSACPRSTPRRPRGGPRCGSPAARCSRRRRWPSVGGTALALERIGLAPISRALVASSPTWVLVALGLMCVSMLLRAVSWHAILRAALPEALPRLVDAVQGTTIGVLMSATLPGPPRRALARADRGAQARPRARAAAGGARHADLPDAAQRARAGRSSGRSCSARSGCSPAASRR